MNIRMRKVSKDQKNCLKSAAIQEIHLDNASMHLLGFKASKRMNEREYLAAKEHLAAGLAEAQADYQKKLDALESTWTLLQDLAKTRGVPLTTESRPVISDLIRAVLPTMGDQFQKHQILAAIEKKFPESKGTFRLSSVSGTITRMCKRGELLIAERGRGPDGFVYRRGKS